MNYENAVDVAMRKCVYRKNKKDYIPIIRSRVDVFDEYEKRGFTGVFYLRSNYEHGEKLIHFLQRKYAVRQGVFLLQRNCDASAPKIAIKVHEFELHKDDPNFTAINATKVDAEAIANTEDNNNATKGRKVELLENMSIEAKSLREIAHSIDRIATVFGINIGQLKTYLASTRCGRI